MDISEVRVKLIDQPTDRLKAFCSVTLDGDFVIRDLKIIEGTSGMFVAMPSRKLADRCPKCRSKNHLRANHCNECGASLPRDRVKRDAMGRTKLHADIAHPINTACRERLQARVVEAYKEELERSKEPGYQPVSDEAEYESDDYESLVDELKRDAASRHEERAQGSQDDTPSAAPSSFDDTPSAAEPSYDRQDDTPSTAEPSSFDDTPDSWVDDARQLRQAEAAAERSETSHAQTADVGAQREPAQEDRGQGERTADVQPAGQSDRARHEPAEVKARDQQPDTSGQSVTPDADDFGAGIV